MAQAASAGARRLLQAVRVKALRRKAGRAEPVCRLLLPVAKDKALRRKAGRAVLACRLLLAVAKDKATHHRAGSAESACRLLRAVREALAGDKGNKGQARARNACGRSSNGSSRS